MPLVLKHFVDRGLYYDYFIYTKFFHIMLGKI